MSNYLIINTSTNIVDNVVEWNGDSSTWQPESGFIGVASTVGCIGWKYNSGGVGIGSTSGETDKMWIPQVGYGTTI